MQNYHRFHCTILFVLVPLFYCSYFTATAHLLTYNNPCSIGDKDSACDETKFLECRPYFPYQLGRDYDFQKFHCDCRLETNWIAIEKECRIIPGGHCNPDHSNPRLTEPSCMKRYFCAQSEADSSNSSYTCRKDVFQLSVNSKTRNVLRHKRQADKNLAIGVGTTRTTNASTAAVAAAEEISQFLNSSSNSSTTHHSIEKRCFGCRPRPFLPRPIIFPIIVPPPRCRHRCCGRRCGNNNGARFGSSADMVTSEFYIGEFYTANSTHEYSTYGEFYI